MDNELPDRAGYIQVAMIETTTKIPPGPLEVVAAPFPPWAFPGNSLCVATPATLALLLGLGNFIH